GRSRQTPRRGVAPSSSSSGADPGRRFPAPSGSPSCRGRAPSLRSVMEPLRPNRTKNMQVAKKNAQLARFPSARLDERRDLVGETSRLVERDEGGRVGNFDQAGVGNLLL